MKRIIILADMDGIAGIESPSQVFPSYDQYWDDGIHQMAADVNAIGKGLVEGGIDQIGVIDAHLTSLNLEYANLDNELELLKGSGFIRASGLIKGLSDCDGVILCGHHAGGGVKDGFLPHTVWPHLRVKINGEMMSETSLYRWLCGEKDIPIIMLSGEETLLRESSRFMKNAPMVSTKKAKDKAHAVCYPLKEVRENLTSTAKSSAERLSDFQAEKPPSSVNLEMSAWKKEEGEILVKLLKAQKVSERSVRIDDIEFVEAFNTIFDLGDNLMKLWFKDLLGIGGFIRLGIKLAMAKLIQGKDMGVYLQESSRTTLSNEMKRWADEWLREPTQEWYL